MTTATAPAYDELLSPPVMPDMPKAFFGEVTTLDIWECVLQTGGKVPFDAGFHSPSQRRLAVKVGLTCAKKDGGSYDVDQDDINTGSKWGKTAESLRTLGFTQRAELESLHGKFAKAERVPTGKTYTAKSGAKAGQVVDELALVFLTIYDSAEACQAAEQAHYAPRNGNGDAPSGRNAPQPVSAADNLGTGLRDTLLATLPKMWALCKQDYARFGKLIESNAQYAQNGITLASVEIIDLTGEMPF